MANEDLGTLRYGIEVDSKGIDKGEEAMDALQKTAEETGKKVDGAEKSIDKVGTTSTKSAKDVDRLDKSTKEAGLSMRDAVGYATTLAASLGAIAAVSANAGKELNNMARLSGTSVEDFQRLAYGANEAGVSAEKLGDIYKDARDKMGDFSLNAGGELMDFFDNVAPKIGVTADQFKNLSGPEILQGLADAMDKANLSGNEQINILESLADEASLLGPMLANNGAGFKKAADEIDGLNGVLSQTQVDKLVDVSKEFNNLSTTISRGTQAIVADNAEDIIDAINTVSETIATATKFLNENMDTIAAVSKILGAGAIAWYSYRAAILASTKATKAFALLMNTTPVGRLVTVVGLLGGAMLALADDTDEAAKSTRFLTTDINNLTDAQKENLRVGIESRLAEIKAEIKLLEERNELYQSQIDANKKAKKEGGADVIYRGRAPIGDSKTASKDIREAKKEIDELEESAKKLEETLNNLNKPMVIEINSGQPVKVPVELKIDTKNLPDLSDVSTFVDDEFVGVIEDDLTPALREALGVFQEMIETATFDEWADGIGSVLNSFKQLTDEVGSGSAEMEVAIKAVQMAQAISAVLNQAQGDPYTAPARMAAMAGAVAAIGGFAISLGSLGGSLEGSYKQRQKEQGTGGLLGMSDEKSNSILEAVKNTADATEKLVGIQSDMLSKFEGLSSAIVGMSSLTARDLDFGGFSGAQKMDGFLESFTKDTGSLAAGVSNVMLKFANSLGGVGDIITTSLNKILGGKSSISDEGIEIVGGYIADFIDETNALAYQEVKSKKYAWSSTKKSTATAAVSDALENQIDGTMEGIFDSVGASLGAIGYDGEKINEKLSSIIIDSFKISLKDLDAEEQADELIAVFSKILDDVAMKAAPSLEQFQKAGEGYGQTLARLATETQVTDELIRQLSMTELSGTIEEQVASSNALSEAMGGAGGLAESFTSFIDEFATEEQKFSILTDEVTRAFENNSISLSESREGLYDYAKALDLNTEAGRAAFAAITNLTPVVSDYYDNIERLEQERLESISEKMALELDLALARGETDLAERISLELELAEANSEVSKGYIKAISDAEKLMSAMDLAKEIDVWSESTTETAQALDSANMALQAIGMTGYTYMSAFKEIEKLSGGDLVDFADELGISFDKLKEYITSLKVASDAVTNDPSDSVVSNARARVSGLQSTIDNVIGQYFDGMLPTAEDISKKIMTMSLDIQSNAVDYDSLLEPYADIVGAIESSAGQQIEQIGDLQGAYFTALGEYFGRSVSEIVDESAIQDAVLKELNAYSNQMRGRNLLTDEIEQWSQSLADGLFDVSDMKSWINDAEETGVYQSFQAVKDLISSVSDQSDTSGIDDLRALQNAMSNLPAAQLALQEAIEALAESDAEELSNEFGAAIGKQKQLQNSILSLQGDTAAIQAAEIEAIKEINGWRQYNLVGLQEELNALEDYSNTVGMLREELELDDISAQQAMNTLGQFGDNVKDVLNSIADLSESELSSFFSETGLSAQDLEDNLEPLIEVFQDASSELGTALEQAETAADEALAILKRSIDKRKEELADAYESQSAALTESISETTESITKLESVAKTLSDAIENAVDESTELSRKRLDSARSEIAALAASGIIPDEDKLNDLIDRVTGDNAQYYKDAESYYYEQGKTANDIAALSVIADSQLSEAEQALENQELQLEQLKKQYEINIEDLDSKYKFYSDELDALNNINVSVMAVVGAVNNLEAAISNLAEAQAYSNSGVDVGVIKDKDNSISAADLAYEIDSQYGGKATLEEVAKGLSDAGVSIGDEFLSGGSSSDFLGSLVEGGYNLGLADGYTPDGSHANGLESVPFDGYRAELHRGEMVLPKNVADDIRTMSNINSLNQSGSIEAIQQMNISLSNQLAASTEQNMNMAENMKKMYNLWKPALAGNIMYTYSVGGQN